MRSGSKHNPPLKLRYFTGSLRIKQFDFSKRLQTPKSPYQKRTKRNSACAWTPQSGPQTRAYESTADITGYGGAVGGGKTDLLLGAAGTQHRRSIIFRRVFPSVRGIIERSREIFNAGNEAHARDSYNEQLHIWRLADKRMIEFASMQYEEDKKKYQGRPHDFYGFDELTEFAESQFRFVTAWNRSTYVNKETLIPQRCRVIATFNPPLDEAGGWVISFFGPWLDPDHPRPAEDGELRWYVRYNDKDREVAEADLRWYADRGPGPEEIASGTPFKVGKRWIIPMRGVNIEGAVYLARSRTFFHATLKDNPILAATGYGATVDALPEPLRSLLKGNFNAAKVVNPWQIIPTEWVRAAQARWKPEGGSADLDSVGLDVARGGQDQTLIAKLFGLWFAPLEKYPGAATPDGPSAAALVLPYAHARAGIHVDVIGIGSSAYDSLAAVEGLMVFGVNNSEAAPAGLRDKSGRLKFRNVRAASYWLLREALDPIHGENIALPPDPELRADLCAAQWSLTTAGVQVESKDDIKKRLGRSPDCADAVVMAYWGSRYYYEPGI